MSNPAHEDSVTYQNVGTVSGGLIGDIKPQQRATALRGAQILAMALRAEGADTLFGYPGATNLVTDIPEVVREAFAIAGGNRHAYRR